MNLEVNSYHQTETTSIMVILEQQFRCEVCNKLLAKPNQNGIIAGEIKCPRCGHINEK